MGWILVVVVVVVIVEEEIVFFERRICQQQKIYEQVILHCQKKYKKWGCVILTSD
jgi:hypothetical protein